jgi:hypothetical protein
MIVFRKVLLSGFVLCLCAGCTSDEPAVPVPTGTVEVSTVGAPGCDFAANLPNAAANPSGPSELTQDIVDEAVADAPEEVREDVRVLMNTALIIQNKAKELAAMPQEERAQKSGELLTLQNDPAFRQAFDRYSTWVRTNCPELASLLPSATPG